ncbi:hypothetical protein Lal_00042955 [Lupinus albus]|nr:hypothetical protein Lal_00042955 [Lupinus albus]
METCRALKHGFHDLIDSKWLEFKDTIPTITGNPLPNHGNQGLNVLEKDDDMVAVEKVEDIKTPLKVICKVLCQQGLVEMVGGGAYEDDVCMMHGIVDHTLERCTEFKALVQNLLNSRLLAGETRHPDPFPYKSDKDVPWKYQGKSMAKSKQIDEVVNLAGVGNMTRSGRVYSPVDLSKKIINASKSKEKIVETSEDRPEPEPGKGLGKYGQGMENTLVLQSNSGRAGVGYSPSNCREGASEDNKGRVAQLGTFTYKGRKVLIPHISQSFVSTCFIKLDTIAMVEDDQPESDIGLVYQCIPGTRLSNWTEEDVASDVYYAM